MKLIRKSNIEKESYRPGNYRLYNAKGKMIYTGSSKRVKHRLEALLYGRADYAQVDGKDGLRHQAKYYDVEYMPIKEARWKEKKAKIRCKFNRL